MYSLKVEDFNEEDFALYEITFSYKPKLHETCRKWSEVLKTIQNVYSEEDLKVVGIPHDGLTFLPDNSAYVDPNSEVLLAWTEEA